VLSVGLAGPICIHTPYMTVYDRMFGNVPADYTVFTRYIYIHGSGQALVESY